jgi:hypothetical protein
MTDELVHYDAADGVATLTLDSQHNRNALSRQLVGELFEGLDRAEDDAEVKVVVIRAEGRTFCSGADLSEASEDGMEKAAGVLVDLQRRIATLTKPVVTRLHGNVRAGGIGIVAASDIALSADDATYAFTEVRLGPPRPRPRLGTRTCRRGCPNWSPWCSAADGRAFAKAASETASSRTFCRRICPRPGGSPPRARRSRNSARSLRENSRRTAAVGC